MTKVKMNVLAIKYPTSPIPDITCHELLQYSTAVATLQTPIDIDMVIKIALGSLLIHLITMCQLWPSQLKFSTAFRYLCDY